MEKCGNGCYVFDNNSWRCIGGSLRGLPPGDLICKWPLSSWLVLILSKVWWLLWLGVQWKVTLTLDWSPEASRVNALAAWSISISHRNLFHSSQVNTNRSIGRRKEGGDKKALTLRVKNGDRIKTNENVQQH